MLNDIRAAIPRVAALIFGLGTCRFASIPSLAVGVEPELGVVIEPGIGGRLASLGVRLGVSRAPPPPPPPPPPVAVVMMMPLNSLAALEAASAPGLTAILWLRGFSAPPSEMSASRDAFHRAVQATPGLARGVVIDDASDGVAANTLSRSLGVAADVPFAAVLSDFAATRTKFLLSASATDGRALEHGFKAVVARRVQPTLLGVARPPRDRSQGTGEFVTEVVTETFDELVTSFQGRCLLVTYSRGCDACAAFAPRVRILGALAARFSCSSLRIARLNVGDNDSDPNKIPPQAPTPMVLLFDSQTKSSPQVFPFVKDGESGRLHLPTLSQLAAWALPGADGTALVAAATRADAEAERLERAFDALSSFAAAWRVVAAAEGAPAATAAAELKVALIAAYAFLVDEAGEGDAQKAETLVSTVAHIAARHSDAIQRAELEEKV